MRRFVSLEPAFWAELPLCSADDCIVVRSKESRIVLFMLYVQAFLFAVVLMLVHLHRRSLFSLQWWADCSRRLLVVYPVILVQ